MQQTGHVATDILKENENLRIRLEKAEGMLRAMRGDDAEAPILLAEADPQDRTLPGREAKANRVPAEMLAQIADAVIAIDENNQITYLSPSAERLYGIAASDALGRPLADVFSPPWLKTDDELAVAIALRDHGEWTGENVHVASDGRAMNVEMRITSLKDEEGQTNGRIAAIRDVSSRKQNEKQLLVSEIRYRRLFEAAHDGVLIVDAATRKIVDANPFMTGLLGYPHADLVGMEIFEIGLFTDAQASQDMFQALNISGQMRYENLPLQTEDGARCEVEVVANRYDENGHSFIQFNVRDITERKLTQKALSDTDNRFRLALENSHITVFEQDLDLRYTWIYDPKLRSAANEVLGKTDADLMDAAIARQLTTIKREVLETGQPVNREVAGGIAGQAPEYFDLKVEPRRDANGRINGIICSSVEITERKNAEAALKESELRYRTLIDATSALTWSVAPSGVVVEPQPQWTAFTGQSTTEMLEGGHVAAFHPDDAENAWARWTDAVARNRPYQNEVRIRRHDGEWRWMRVHFVPIHKDGVGDEWFGMCVDISERKQAERQLKLSEAKLQLGLQVAGTGLGTTDYQKGTITLDRTAAAFFDLPENQPIPRADVHARFHPDDTKNIFAKMAKALKPTGDGVVALDHRIVRSDQSVMWVSARKHIEFSDAPDGSRYPRRGLFAVQDITERKRAEAALRDSETQFKRVLQQSPEGIVQTDADGRIVLFNNRWCEMLGYSESEMLGASDTELTHPSSVEATLESVGRLANGGPDFQIEKNYRRKDGVMIRCSSNVAALRDSEGNFQGMLAVVLDMTRRLTAEDQLRERDRQNQFLLELSDRLRAASDATAVMSAAAELFARHCGFPLVQYLIIEPDGDQFHAVGSYSDGWLPDALHDTGRLSDHGPGWGLQFHNGESVFSDDHNDRPKADADASQSFGIRSGSAIPLLRNGRLVALFTTASPVPRHWTSAEKTLQQEVAERTWAAVERVRAETELHAAHDTFRNLVDRSPFGIYAVDADFRLVQVSDGAQKVFENVWPLIGRDFADVVRIIWPEPFATEAIGRFRNTLATGAPYHASNSVEQRADISATEAYDWKIEQVTLPDGRPGVVCHFYDYSEKQRQEQHIKLLMGEVNHRAKNMLSLIQAIARQTAKTRPEEFLESFGERIRALSASQDLLVKSEWKAVQLEELVRSQLAHFGDPRDTRIMLDGPPVKITAAASQSLGMALHELATNAAKFGALSNEDGRVMISWSLQANAAGQRQFALSWIESGGPAVAEPARRGFGSTVIDGMLKMSLGCDAHVDFAPTGLVWRIACPAEDLIVSDAPAAPRSNGAAVAEPEAIDGRRILVVEDEPIIAMDFAQTLSEAGYVVVGPANSVAQALALIVQFGCDAAVLDTNLGAETSEAVARALVKRGTPYVATSGYSREQQPEFMQDAPLLGKPVRADTLLAEVERCLGGE